MKKMIVILIAVILALVLNAGGITKTNDINRDLQNSNLNDESSNNYLFSYRYFTFEEAMQWFATDVVIAQYVNHKAFGNDSFEYEFIVQERILGNAPDRIFVYSYELDRKDTESLAFDHGIDYLLPLEKETRPYTKGHEDGFMFILNTVIDLNEPRNSIMQRELLSEHIEGLNFRRRVTRHDIISYVEMLVKDNTLAIDYIKSDFMEDIIKESPYIWIVEINNPLKLVDMQLFRDRFETDIYYCTVIKSLKGDVDEGSEVAITFFAGTVFPGEHHIVTLSSLKEGGSGWYHFSSKNSLFRMDQLDEILAIIEKDSSIIN